MGKLSLLLLAAVGFTAIYTTTQALADDRRADSVMLRQRALEIEARQAALTGYAEAAERLGSDPSLVGKAAMSPMKGTHSAGDYTVRFEVLSTTPYAVRMRSVGVADGAGGSSEEYVVEGVFEPRADVAAVSTNPTETLERVPPYMRYALFSEESISFTLMPRVLANGNGFNANVHSNKNISMAFSLSSLIPSKGFGSYVGSATGMLFFFNPASAFDPPVNPGKSPTIAKIPRVNFPSFTVDGLLRNVAGTAVSAVEPITGVLDVVGDATGFLIDYRGGKTQLFGTIKLGTRENPKLIYVDGDLTLFNVTMEGYGAFVVKGNVFFESTFTGLASWVFGAPESRVAYYTDGNVWFNGLGHVHGQIVANGNVNFTLANSFYGSITSRKGINFLGLPTVRFTSPSPALTTFLPGNPVAQTLKETSIREWETVPAL